MTEFYNQHQSKINSSAYILGFTSIVLATLYLAFANLGNIPIYDWDEARHGISAYEMSQNGSFLVNTYLWENDYWNLKPPLSFWSIMLAYKIFGYSPFALRFFSALSLCIITALSMLLLQKSFGRFSALVTGSLFATVCVHLNHLFWSGDPDALYCLFLFLSLVSLFFAYIKSSNWWIGVSFFLSLAFLTKSFHVFTFLAGFFMAWIFISFSTKNWQVKNIFKKALPAFALPILLWGITRYTIDGWAFLGQMFSVDVVERVGNDETLLKGFPYYFAWLNGVLGFAFCILICIAVLGLLLFAISHKQQLTKKDFIFAIICFSTFLVTFLFYGVIGGAISWYIWPMFLGLFPFVGWGSGFVWRTYQTDISTKKFFAALTSLFLFFTALSMPSLKKIQMSYDLGSLNPTRSIFYDVKEIEESFPAGEKIYYSVDSTGMEKTPSQSWILMGYYQDFFYQPGTFEDFLNDTRENVYLLVQTTYESPLQPFLDEEPQVRRVLQGDSCALCALKTE